MSKSVLGYTDLELTCAGTKIPDMHIEYGKLPDGQVFFMAVVEDPPRRIFSGRFMYDGDEPIKYIIDHIVEALHDAAVEYVRQTKIDAVKLTET